MVGCVGEFVLNIVTTLHTVVYLFFMFIYICYVRFWLCFLGEKYQYYGLWMNNKSNVYAFQTVVELECYNLSYV